MGFLDLFSEPQWVKDLKQRLDRNSAQNSQILQNQVIIMERQLIVMALVQVDQTVLDAIGDTLDEIADAVQTIVDNDDNPLQDADMTGITGPISRLQEILTKPEVPVDSGDEPAPAEPETNE